MITILMRHSLVLFLALALSSVAYADPFEYA